MRKIKVAAIQPAQLEVPEAYHFGSPAFIPDVESIIKNCVLPRAEVTFTMLEEVGKTGADIITTCEDLSYASAYIFDVSESSVFPPIVEKTYTIIEERLSHIAKKYDMNIVACYYKPWGGKLHNTASIFNRSGEIIGDYKKTHIPPFEFCHATEGNVINVIDTDIGRIGIMICYDMMFPSMGEVLSSLGAEIVFHPTFGYGWSDSIGEATLRTRASDGSFFLVTAKNYVSHNQAGKSSVIDPWGTVLVDAGYARDTFIMHEIDLHNPKLHKEDNIHTLITGKANVRDRREGEKRTDLYSRVTTKTVDRYNFPPPGKEREAFIAKVMDIPYHW